jgi:type II secretory pathway component PulK
LWTKKWFEDDAFDYDWYYDEDDWHYDDEWYFRVDFKGFNTIAIPATPIPASWQSPLSSAPPAARIAEQRAVVAAASATMPKPAKPRPFKYGDVELEWMGRSGVELARYAVAQQRETYDALNQPWAGATWDTNSPLATLPLQGFRLNGGTVSVTIVDLERKANINVVPGSFTERALRLNEVSEDNTPGIVESIADWQDADDNTRPQGAETTYYQTLPTRYRARNGLMTEIAELAYVKGSNHELVFGPAGTNVIVPLRDMFTTISSGFINVNTTTRAVLQLLPGCDANLAESVVATRAGADGIDGTADDMAFRSVADLTSVPGMTPDILNAASPYLDVRSATFEATITARLGASVRTYVAWLRRISASEVVVLKMREM